MKTINKAFSADVTVDEGERAVMATITTAAVDRDGEVLVPQGCYTKDFEKNPSVFLGHDYYNLPIGKCAAIRRTPDAIVAKTVFAERPADFPVGQEWIPDTLFSLFQQGVLKGFSVGFLPIESRPATDKDVEKFGAGVRRVYSKWNLLEYSVAAIPANPEAIAMAVSKGFVKAATAKAIFGKDAVGTATEPETVEAPEPVSAVVVDEAGEYHAGEVIGESAAETEQPKEDEAVTVIHRDEPIEVTPGSVTVEAVKPKRMTVFMPVPVPQKKRVNIVQVASHAVARARGRVYATE